MYIGVGLALVVIVPAMVWYSVASNAWVQRLLPPPTPGQLDVFGFRGRQTPFRMMLSGLRHVSDDPAIEFWRVRADHRWRIVVVLLPSVIVFPIVAVMAEACARRIAVGPVGIAILILEVALIAFWSARLAGYLVGFGNGHPLSKGLVLQASMAIAGLLSIVIVQGTVVA